MDRLGTYEIKQFSKDRQNVVLVASEGIRRHNAHALLEIDVTRALEIIQKMKDEKRDDVLFTAWIMKCVGQAASEYKVLNAYRLGRRKLVMFDDVDISMPVEREVGGKPFIMAYIVRKVNEKSVSDINQEIRSVQQKPVDGSLQAFGDQLTPWERRLLHAPLFLKKIGMVMVRRNGIFKKEHFGMIGFMGIGMEGRFPGFVIGVGGPIASFIAVGGITKKPGVVDGKILVREFLHVTIHIDHDVVSWSSLAGFTDRLVELLETGFGLPSS